MYARGEAIIFLSVEFYIEPNQTVIYVKMDPWNDFNDLQLNVSDCSQLDSLVSINISHLMTNDLIT